VIAGADIRRDRAAEDLERCQLDRFRVEPRPIDDGRRRLGFDDRAGQVQVERLANGDGADARPPPAVERVDFLGGLRPRRWGLGHRLLLWLWLR